MRFFAASSPRACRFPEPVEIEPVKGEDNDLGCRAVNMGAGGHPGGAAACECFFALDPGCS